MLISLNIKSLFALTLLFTFTFAAQAQVTPKADKARQERVSTPDGKSTDLVKQPKAAAKNGSVVKPKPNNDRVSAPNSATTKPVSKNSQVNKPVKKDRVSTPSNGSTDITGNKQNKQAAKTKTDRVKSDNGKAYGKTKEKTNNGKAYGKNKTKTTDGKTYRENKEKMRRKSTKDTPLKQGVNGDDVERKNVKNSKVKSPEGN